MNIKNAPATSFEARLLAALPLPGQRILTGKRGRPAFAATAENVANDYFRFLPVGARAIAEEQPFEALTILGNLRRPLTQDEQDILAQTTDATFQGLRDGEPCQVESRSGHEFSDPATGAAMFEAVILPNAVNMAKFTGRVHFVRLARWAIARTQRGQNDTTLTGLTAKFQHKFYTSDSSDKGGFLTLAIVHGDGRIERIGSSAITTVPNEIGTVVNEIATVVNEPTETRTENLVRRYRDADLRTGLGEDKAEAKRLSDAQAKREKAAAKKGTAPKEIVKA